MEYSYRINGKTATEREAKAHWLASGSYDSANRKTRDRIWREAHREDGGPWGEINWLREAGIQIVPNAPSERGENER